MHLCVGVVSFEEVPPQGLPTPSQEESCGLWLETVGRVRKEAISSSWFWCKFPRFVSFDHLPQQWSSERLLKKLDNPAENWDVKAQAFSTYISPLTKALELGDLPCHCQARLLSRSACPSLLNTEGPVLSQGLCSAHWQGEFEMKFSYFTENHVSLWQGMWWHWLSCTHNALMWRALSWSTCMPSKPWHSCGLKIYWIRDYCVGQGLLKDLGFWSMPEMLWCQSSINTSTFPLWKLKSGVHLVVNLRNYLGEKSKKSK